MFPRSIVVGVLAAAGVFTLASPVRADNPIHLLYGFDECGGPGADCAVRIREHSGHGNGS